MGGLDLSFFNRELFERYLAHGIAFSLELTAVAMVLGIFFGTLIALMRLSGRPWLALPAAAYVDAMRSIPLVMVILWFFLVIPLILGQPIGAQGSAFITFAAF